MRVLVCDDEPSVRLLFRTALESPGIEVAEATGLSECLATASDRRPDVVILDVMLRDGEAPDILPALRALCPGTVIMIVSALAAGSTFDRCLAAGADACYDKLQFLPRIVDLVVGGVSAV